MLHAGSRTMNMGPPTCATPRRPPRDKSPNPLMPKRMHAHQYAKALVMNASDEVSPPHQSLIIAKSREARQEGSTAESVAWLSPALPSAANPLAPSLLSTGTQGGG